MGREERGGWQAADLGASEMLVIHSSVPVACSPRGPPWPQTHDSLQVLAQLGTDLATSPASPGHLNSEAPFSPQVPTSRDVGWPGTWDTWAGIEPWELSARRGSELPRKPAHSEEAPRKEEEAPRKNVWKAAREAGENPAAAWMSTSESQEDPS